MFFSNTVTIRNVQTQVLSNVEAARASLENTIKEYAESLELFCIDQEVILSLKYGDNNPEFRRSIYQKISLVMAGRFDKSIMYVFNKDNTFSIATNNMPVDYDPVLFEKWGVFRLLKNNPSRVVLFPNRYTSPADIPVSLTLAREIRDSDNEIVGYALIDLSEEAIKDAVCLNNNFLPIGYTIFTKNCYIIYDDYFRVFDGNVFNLEFRELLLKQTVTQIKYNYQGQELIIAGQNSGETNFILIGTTPVNMAIKGNRYIQIITIILSLFSSLLCILASYIITRSISRPINDLLVVMKHVEQGDMTVRSNIKRNDEIGALSDQLNYMIMKVDELFKRNIEKQDLLHKAELSNLQAQIKPHFLYNMLDLIKWLSKFKKNDEIDSVIIKLGNILRSNVHAGEEMVTVKESIDLIEDYLSLQKMRYSDKLSVSIYVDPSTNLYKIPKLIIQPIIENAVIHGIEPKIKPGYINISVNKRSEKLEIRVEDNGIGMDAEVFKLSDVPKEKTSRLGTGLWNVYRRLKLHYGEQGEMQIFSNKDIGTTVVIRIPVIMEGHNANA